MEQENKNLEVIKPLPIQVAANDKGILIGENLDEQWRLANAYVKSGLMPAAFNTPEKVLVGMQFLRELGVPVITGLRQVYVLNGTPNLYGDLPISLVMRSGQLEDIEEHVDNDQNGNPFKATCTLKRKGISTPTTRSFSMADAHRAGLGGKGPWKSYPARMLQCRARAWAIKDLFPDMLNGACIMEYEHGTMPDENGEAQSLIANKRSSLNDQFAPGPVARMLTGNLTSDHEHDKKNEIIEPKTGETFDDTATI